MPGRRQAGEALAQHQGRHPERAGRASWGHGTPLQLRCSPRSVVTPSSGQAVEAAATASHHACPGTHRLSRETPGPVGCKGGLWGEAAAQPIARAPWGWQKSPSWVPQPSLCQGQAAVMLSGCSTVPKTHTHHLNTPGLLCPSRHCRKAGHPDCSCRTDSRACMAL